MTESSATTEASALADQEKLLKDRINSLNAVLAKKRTRLEAQFAALERSLAVMQDQQNALTALAQAQATFASPR